MKTEALNTATQLYVHLFQPSARLLSKKQELHVTQSFLAKYKENKIEDVERTGEGNKYPRQETALQQARMKIRKKTD